MHQQVPYFYSLKNNPNEMSLKMSPILWKLIKANSM